MLLVNTKPTTHLIPGCKSNNFGQLFHTRGVISRIIHTVFVFISSSLDLQLLHLSSFPHILHWMVFHLQLIKLEILRTIKIGSVLLCVISLIIGKNAFKKESRSTGSLLKEKVISHELSVC